MATSNGSYFVLKAPLIYKMDSVFYGLFLDFKRYGRFIKIHNKTVIFLDLEEKRKVKGFVYFHFGCLRLMHLYANINSRNRLLNRHVV